MSHADSKQRHREVLVELTEPADLWPVRAPLVSFLQFSNEISRGLDQLQDRWEHASAPAAKHSNRGVWR